MEITNTVSKYAKEYKIMGYVITGTILVLGVFVAYNKYIQNKTLTQQSKINKYIIEDWRSKHTIEEQASIEKNSDIIEKVSGKIINKTNI